MATIIRLMYNSKGHLRYLLLVNKRVQGGSFIGFKVKYWIELTI